jgi:hypothetical protein
MGKGNSKPLKRLKRPKGPRLAGSDRPRHGELSTSLRSRIVQARQDGLSWTTIRDTITENGKKLPISTLRSTVRRFASRTSFHSKKISGQPKKISDDDRSRILLEIEKAPYRTVQDLYISLCPFDCETTFRMALREAGKQKWKKLKRPLLLPAHVAARLKWVCN